MPAYAGMTTALLLVGTVALYERNPSGSTMPVCKQPGAALALVAL